MIIFPEAYPESSREASNGGGGKRTIVREDGEKVV
jgi:hypothetical protein